MSWEPCKGVMFLSPGEYILWDSNWEPSHSKSDALSCYFPKVLLFYFFGKEDITYKKEVINVL